MTYKILSTINSPDDIKKLTSGDLKLLADEIRNCLIDSTSQLGGHLASNLGVVELTLSLHRNFNSPKDKIIFDVGHQCYVHKLITGRFKDFKTLRKKGGLSGFPNPCESEHDVFISGHSSTSISSALGIDVSNNLNNNESYTVAVVGDGALTGGLSFEGLNNAGRISKKLIVILNDNDMSISKNVGSLAKYLSKIRTNQSYYDTKDFAEKFLNAIPFLGKYLYKFFYKIKNVLKIALYQDTFFENMGFAYLGPVDGHDMSQLDRVLKRAKKIDKPAFIHVNTKKGKGYEFAENSPKEFHGTSVFDIKTGESLISNEDTYTKAFGDALFDIAKENDKVCAITAAMGYNCSLNNFRENFKNRYFDVGIAESHAVTFSGGLAKCGFKPVFCVYSTFLQRGFDQIIHDVCLQNQNVIFGVDRAGIVGEDGQTHQGLFDIAYLSPIPNLTIYSPAFYDDIKPTLKMALNLKSAVAIRYPRGKMPKIKTEFYGTAEDYQVIDNKSDTLVISFGRMIFNVYMAISELNNKPSIMRLNKIHPLGKEFLNKIIKYKKIIFIEEGYTDGGVCQKVGYMLLKNNFNGKFYSKTIDNKFISHSTVDESFKDLKLDKDSIKKFLEEIV